MDGARFANALVRMNASPAEVTWKAGVDVLSFGATKGGAHGGGGGGVLRPRRSPRTWPSAASAPGICSPSIASWRCSSRRFSTTIAGSGWRATPTPWPIGWPRGLTAAGRPPAWPVEANLVFVVIPKAVEARLKAAGARYYVRRSESPAGVALEPDQCLIRLVTSFATREDEIDSEFVRSSAAKAQLAAAAAPQSAAMLRIGAKVEGHSVKQRMIVRRARRCWRSSRRPLPSRSGSRRAASPARCRPTRSSTMLRSTGLRSDRPAGAARSELRAACRSMTATARSASWSARAPATSLSVTPMQTASRMPPDRRRGGVTMGPYERMPPGYIPPDRSIGRAAPIGRG